MAEGAPRRFGAQSLLCLEVLLLQDAKTAEPRWCDGDTYEQGRQPPCVWPSLAARVYAVAVRSYDNSISEVVPYRLPGPVPVVHTMTVNVYSANH